MPFETASNLIRAGRARIAFDTNQIRGSFASRVKAFFVLAERVNLLRNAAGLDLQIIVPAVVHFEMVHQLRREIGNRFDLVMVARNLADRGVLIEPFDRDTAELAGQRLVEWFVDDAAWQEAKQSANGRAALDWLIATQASVRGWIVVTEDHAGGEFDVLRDLGHCVTRTWLENEIQALCQQHGIV